MSYVVAVTQRPFPANFLIGTSRIRVGSLHTHCYPLEFMPRKAQKRKVSISKQSPGTADAIAEAPEFEAEAIQDFREIAKQRQYLYLLSRVFVCQPPILKPDFLVFLITG